MNNSNGQIDGASDTREHLSKPLTIGLLWHSPNSGNLGVGALTVANMALVREAAGDTPVRFVLLSFVDPGRRFYAEVEGVEVVSINGKAMLPGGAFWRGVRQCDAVLDIGAGDSFADIYGRRRFAYLWASKLIVRLCRVPLIFSPQTIGPFTGATYKWLAGRALGWARIVFARDRLSLEAARKLNPRARVEQVTDVAFALPYRAAPRNPAGPIKVGVNVSGLLFNGGYGGSNQYGLQIDYAAYTRSLIARLAARSDVEIKLICHVNSEAMAADDDGRVADLLKREFPIVRRLPDFEGPSAAKNAIAELDFLIAGRMHACIASFSSGVPFLPVAYSRKFEGVFGLLGYEAIVPVRGLSTEQAVDHTLAAFENRTTLADQIEAGRVMADALLNVYRETMATHLEAMVKAG